VPTALASQIIVLISNTPRLHGYIVHKLFAMVQDELSQEALARVGLWCIGELSKLLLEQAPESGKMVSEKEIIDTIEKMMKAYFSTDKMKAMALTALAKLSCSCSAPGSMRRIAKLAGSYRFSMRLELQQRSTEYSTLFKEEWSDLRPIVLKPQMKPIAEHSTKSNDMDDDMGRDDDDEDDTEVDVEDAPAADEGDSGLLGLSDDEPSGGGDAAPPAAGDDLLSDLFGSSPSPPPATGGGIGDSGGDMMGDLFGQSEPAPAGYPSITAFEADGITLTLSFLKTGDPALTNVTFTSENSSQYDVTQYKVNAATPKYISLKWQGLSGNVLAANRGGTVTQSLELRNNLVGQKTVKMKLKIEYVVNGAAVVKMASVGNFPQGM